MANSPLSTPANRIPNRAPYTRPDSPDRVGFRIGRLIIFLLLTVFLSACAFGGAEESRTTTSLPPIPKAPAGQNESQSAEPATRPQPAEPPQTFTPAPANSSQPAAAVTVGPTGAPTVETGNPVLAIPLAGPVAARRAELSGLAWYGDYLVILPQFPDFDAEGDESFLYALPKEEILAFLDGQHDQPLRPRPIPFVAPGLDDSIPGFEGYEAIAFSGDDAYLVIEASDGGAMLGYLVKGRLDPGLAALTVDGSMLATIAPQTDSFNIAEESVFVSDQSVGVIHELNGARVNPAPVVHLFGLDLTPVGVVAFPNVPFRITDASALDADGRFWVINYFYPGREEVLDAFITPEGDASGEQGWPPAWVGLGRLLEFRFSPSGVRPTGAAPIQLEANLGDIHNWEGLARLDDRGFLLISDEIPDSSLGFVPWPAAE